MIPQRLRLKNFLSYQDLDLDFSGLHIACICGANGAGKSSLLEAITWAIWGECRAKAEDDVIHLGTKEALVDFTFSAYQQVYRVKRSRTKNGSSSLEFQIGLGDLKGKESFKTLTERTMRATQQTILNYLKMDYDTFVNSVYLRQGRADEFMLKKAADRKALLAEILNLSEYDNLCEKAKEVTKICKGQAQAQNQQLEHLQVQLSQGANIETQLAEKSRQLSEFHEQHQSKNEDLQNLQQRQQQCQTWQQQLQWQQNQAERLQTDLKTLAEQRENQAAQLRLQASLLNQTEEINQEYTLYQQWHAQEEVYNQKQQQYQQLTQRQNLLQQELAKYRSQLDTQLERYQTQLENLSQQQQGCQKVFGRSSEIESALAQLYQGRKELEELEKLRSRSLPLIQRQQTLQREVDRQQAQSQARLGELQRSFSNIQLRPRSELEAAILKLEQQIADLKKDQAYQLLVQEKGQERRNFLEGLKSRLSGCEEQYTQNQERMNQLRNEMQRGRYNLPCPLCDRPLDQAHWRLVEEKQKQEAYELQAEIWVIKEQLSTSETEIEILREEYRRLQQLLKNLPELEVKLGVLQAQMQTNAIAAQKSLELEQEISLLNAQIQTGEYAQADQIELASVEKNLKELNYDEKNYALVRGETERWRWAEVKAVELKNASRQFEQINQQLPELQVQISQIQQRLESQQIDPEIQNQLQACDRALDQLNYNPQKHQQIRQAKAQTTNALLRYQELLQAQQQYPILESQYLHLEQLEQEKKIEVNALRQAIAQLQTQIQQIGDQNSKIEQIQAEILQLRMQMDQAIAKIGQLRQAEQQYAQQSQQLEYLKVELSQTLHRQDLHQELQQAFGKNGIQALVIETILPQIEAEANQILGQLSDYQLNVRFITQKARNTKIIDTLEIEIADRSGTRPYETYSGGEAFRINFAVRLALSRILAQRTGGKLQTLIIDEGFGSQDGEGCERLVGVINAIAQDFQCILVITHMPKLKEAFTNLIEVTKTDNGSKISLLN